MAEDTEQSNDAGPGPPEPNNSIPEIDVFKDKLTLQQVNEKSIDIIMNYYSDYECIGNLDDEINNKINELFNNNNIQISEDILNPIRLKANLQFLQKEQITNTNEFINYNIGTKTYTEIYNYLMENDIYDQEFIDSLSDELICILISNEIEFDKPTMESNRIKEALIKFFDTGQHINMSIMNDNQLTNIINKIEIKYYKQFIIDYIFMDYEYSNRFLTTCYENKDEFYTEIIHNRVENKLKIIRFIEQIQNEKNQNNDYFMESQDSNKSNNISSQESNITHISETPDPNSQQSKDSFKFTSPLPIQRSEKKRKLVTNVTSNNKKQNIPHQNNNNDQPNHSPISNEIIESIGDQSIQNATNRFKSGNNDLEHLQNNNENNKNDDNDENNMDIDDNNDNKQEEYDEDIVTTNKNNNNENNNNNNNDSWVERHNKYQEKLINEEIIKSIENGTYFENENELRNYDAPTVEIQIAVDKEKMNRNIKLDPNNYCPGDYSEYGRYANYEHFNKNNQNLYQDPRYIYHKCNGCCTNFNSNEKIDFSNSINSSKPMDSMDWQDISNNIPQFEKEHNMVKKAYKIPQNTLINHFKYPFLQTDVNITNMYDESNETIVIDNNDDLINTSIDLNIELNKLDQNKRENEILINGILENSGIAYCDLKYSHNHLNPETTDEPNLRNKEIYDHSCGRKIRYEDDPLYETKNLVINLAKNTKTNFFNCPKIEIELDQDEQIDLTTAHGKFNNLCHQVGGIFNNFCEDDILKIQIINPKYQRPKRNYLKYLGDNRNTVKYKSVCDKYDHNIYEIQNDFSERYKSIIPNRNITHLIKNGQVNFYDRADKPNRLVIYINKYGPIYDNYKNNFNKEILNQYNKYLAEIRVEEDEIKQMDIKDFLEFNNNNKPNIKVYNEQDQINIQMNLPQNEFHDIGDQYKLYETVDTMFKAYNYLIKKNNEIIEEKNKIITNNYISQQGNNNHNLDQFELATKLIPKLKPMNGKIAFVSRHKKPNWWQTKQDIQRYNLRNKNNPKSFKQLYRDRVTITLRDVNINNIPKNIKFNTKNYKIDIENDNLDIIDKTIQEDIQQCKICLGICQEGNCLKYQAIYDRRKNEQDRDRKLQNLKLVSNACIHCGEPGGHWKNGWKCPHQIKRCIHCGGHDHNSLKSPKCPKWTTYAIRILLFKNAFIQNSRSGVTSNLYGLDYWIPEQIELKPIRTNITTFATKIAQIKQITKQIERDKLIASLKLKRLNHKDKYGYFNQVKNQGNKFYKNNDMEDLLKGNLSILYDRLKNEELELKRQRKIKNDKMKQIKKNKIKKHNKYMEKIKLKWQKKKKKNNKNEEYDQKDDENDENDRNDKNDENNENDENDERDENDENDENNKNDDINGKNEYNNMDIDEERENKKGNDDKL